MCGVPNIVLEKKGLIRVNLHVERVESLPKKKLRKKVVLHTPVFFMDHKNSDLNSRSSSTVMETVVPNDSGSTHLVETVVKNLFANNEPI